MDDRSPPSLEWSIGVAKVAVMFFSISADVRKIVYGVLGRPQPTDRFEPFSVLDLILFLPHEEIEVTGRRANDVEVLLAKMAAVGILVPSGSTRSGLFERTYMLGTGLHRSQALGQLWLAPVLGPSLIVQTLRPRIAHITGVSEGIVRGGSGFLLDDRHVLTAGHVVADMNLDDYVHLDNIPVRIEGRPRLHTRSDVAVVEIAASDVPKASGMEGVVFRDPEWADRVTLLGYPPIPTARDASLTVQSGEIVNPAVSAFTGGRHFLFSAIARPGNSGGPIVAADGRVLGIVTREFSDAANHQTHPFYAGCRPRRWSKRWSTWACLRLFRLSVGTDPPRMRHSAAHGLAERGRERPCLCAVRARHQASSQTAPRLLPELSANPDDGDTGTSVTVASRRIRRFHTGRSVSTVGVIYGRTWSD